ncbi:MAG: ATP synthase F1 subunit epsilon [Acetobacteraceae bacterium]
MPVALEIVSPERLLLSRSVEMVVIPAQEGDMGVLEGHTPMMVTLRGGVIVLYENDQVIEQLFVAGGFAEVTQERCTVLANEALPVAELSRDESERRLQEAEAEFAQLQGADIEEQFMALDRVHAARAMMEAAETLLSGSR